MKKNLMIRMRKGMSIGLLLMILIVTVSEHKGEAQVSLYDVYKNPSSKIGVVTKINFVSVWELIKRVELVKSGTSYYLNTTLYPEVIMNQGSDSDGSDEYMARHKFIQFNTAKGQVHTLRSYT